MLPGIHIPMLGGGAAPIEIIATDINNDSGSGATSSFDFTSVTVGAGEAGKVLIVAVTAEHTTNSPTMSTVVVDPAGDNVSLTKLIDIDGAGVDDQYACALFGGIIGNIGSTATIRVTTSADGWISMACVSLRNVQAPIVPTFTGSTFIATAGTGITVANATAPAGGFLMTCGVNERGTSQSVTYDTVPTERSNAVTDAGTSHGSSGWDVFSLGLVATDVDLTYTQSDGRALVVVGIR